MTPIISFLYLGLLFLEVSDFSHVEGSLVSSSTVDTNVASIATVLPVSTADSHKETTAILREKPTDSHKEASAVPREKPTDSHKETSDSPREKPTDSHKETTAILREKPTDSHKEASAIPREKPTDSHKETSDSPREKPTDNLPVTSPNSSTVNHENEMSEEQLINEQNGYPSKKVTGIIIGCFVGLFLSFIIFALITTLRKKKVHSYSFDLSSKSPEESGIPLNDVTA
ncbi:uncharacterized protein [Ranitomeya imitator]|uniref:uncharacterized protein isoform X4 n=1 Tax=Ranitomeya imitator TaxID=111125 RepID=UPI0037E84CCF